MTIITTTYEETEMNRYTRIAAAIAGFSTLLAGGIAQAESFTVTITNATANQVITPPVLITHDSGVGLFDLGQAAPDYLVPLAEGGDISAFANADDLDEVSSVVLAGGPIPPGHSASFSIETDNGHPLLTVAAMLASSNDAFIAVNGQPLDFGASSQQFDARVYDAGSEFNSEDCRFIPGPPCGNPGVRDTAEAEGFVYVHSGLHGTGDLQPSIYSWNNPGAVVTVTRDQ